VAGCVAGRCHAPPNRIPSHPISLVRRPPSDPDRDPLVAGLLPLVGGKEKQNSERAKQAARVLLAGRLGPVIRSTTPHCTPRIQLWIVAERCDRSLPEATALADTRSAGCGRRRSDVVRSFARSLVRRWRARDGAESRRVAAGPDGADETSVENGRRHRSSPSASGGRAGGRSVGHMHRTRSVLLNAGGAGASDNWKQSRIGKGGRRGGGRGEGGVRVAIGCMRTGNNGRPMSGVRSMKPLPRLPRRPRFKRLKDNPSSSRSRGPAASKSSSNLVLSCAHRYLLCNARHRRADSAPASHRSCGMANLGRDTPLVTYIHTLQSWH